MTQIKLDESLAEDLITSKLQTLQQYINKILIKWKESSSKDFLEKAHTGYYKNAEDNAVVLRQLLLDYTKLQELLNRL